MLTTLGVMRCGGVFRNSSGNVICCFHRIDNVGFAFEAELIVVIHALEIAYPKGLQFFWV